MHNQIHRATGSTWRENDKQRRAQIKANARFKLMCLVLAVCTPVAIYMLWGA